MIDVTCAIIRNDDGLVLAVRRGPGMSNAGKWEFPGGKTKPGEDDEDCIVREITEELSIEIIISGRLEPVIHDYGDRTIRLIPFVCDTLAAAPHLSVHDEYRWMRPAKLLSLSMSAADLPVAREYISSQFNDVHPVSSSYTDEDDESLGQVMNHDSSENITDHDEIARAVGRISSTEEIAMVARSAVTDNVLLSHLVTLSASHEKRVGFMASWALSKVSDTDIALLKPYLASFVDDLPNVANESVQRSFMRILTKCDMADIPVSHHVKLIDYCMEIMRSEQNAVAPKAYSIEILSKMTLLYPSMVSEVAAAIQMTIAEGKPGIIAMGRKAIKRMKPLI